MMSNGYKPSPLDLSDIKLTPGQELLVDKLAENAHNVWAKDRIKQGWTYGIQQVHWTFSCTAKQTFIWVKKNKKELALTRVRSVCVFLLPSVSSFASCIFYVLSFSFMLH